MSLLAFFSLKAPPGLAMARASMPPGTGQSVPSAGAHAPGARSDNGHAAGASATPGGSEERSAALKLKASIEAQHAKATATYSKLDEAEPKLKQLIAAAKGPEKAELEKKQTLLVRTKAEARRTLDQARTDLEAIDSAGTSREELVALLARRKSGATLETEVEISAKGLDPYSRHGNKDVAVTTTSLKNGTGRIDTRRDQHKVGLDGVTNVHGEDSTNVTANSTVRKIHEKKTNASPTGKLSSEETDSIEIETADGKTSKLETTKAAEISAKGGSRSKSVVTTNLDGSSKATNKNVGVERGEGQAVASAGGSSTTTSAAGQALTQSAKGSGGLVAGKDGLGAKGAGEAGVKTANKNGFNTGASLGLHANVTCKINEVPGTPPRYAVDLTVELGVSLSLNAGHAKEGGKASIGFTANASKTEKMIVHHELDEKQIAEYTRALKAANSGTVAATGLEFKVIAAGVKEGWAVAQQLWKGNGQVLSREMILALKKGDFVELSGSDSKSVGVNVDVKAVSLGGNVKSTSDHSTRVSGNDKGTVDVAANASNTTERSGQVGVSMGGVSAQMGAVHKVTTRLGYEITIDPKDDPDNKVFTALGACKSDADYEAFVAKYKPLKKITVVSKTVGKATDDAEKVGFEIAGKNLNLDYGHGVDDSTTEDGEGNFQHRDVIGTAHVGGDFLGVGDSRQDEATAKVDAKGNASLDLTQTHNDTDYGKVGRNLVRKVPGGGHLVGKDDKKPDGALTQAAGGGESETATKDIAILKLGQADLKRIGQIVVTHRSMWNNVPQRSQENAAWREAGDNIAAAKGKPSVVAVELAKFVGGDNERLQRVQQFARAGGDVTTGTISEFPESLKDKRKEYERLVTDPFEADLDALMARDGPLKATSVGNKLIADLDEMSKAVYAADDFAKESIQAEMMSSIGHRKMAVMAKVRSFAGHDATATEDRSAAQEKLRMLVAQCYRHSPMETGLFAKLDDMLDGHPHFRQQDHVDVEDWLRQLKDLYAVWDRDFDEALAAAKAMGFSEIPPYLKVPMLHMQPDRTEYKRFRKARGLRD